VKSLEGIAENLQLSEDIEINSERGLYSNILKRSAF